MEDDDLERTVTQVFRDVLNAPGLGPESHFFEAGGDPACAHEACRTLQNVTGRTLCFVQVARHPTARELANHLRTTPEGPPRCPAHGMVHRLIHRHETHHA